MIFCSRLTTIQDPIIEKNTNKNVVTVHPSRMTGNTNHIPQETLVKNYRTFGHTFELQ